MALALQACDAIACTAGGEERTWGPQPLTSMSQPPHLCMALGHSSLWLLVWPVQDSWGDGLLGEVLPWPMSLGVLSQMLCA